MLRYSIRRVLSSIVILILISILAFLLMNVLPGDPAARIVGINATPELIEQTKERLGLNEPLHERYASWFFHALQGDLGDSTIHQTPIAETFGRRIPATLNLGILSLMVVVGLAVPIGVLAALKPGSKREVTASTLMIVGNSVPEFLTGIGLVLLVGLHLDLLPVVGYVPFWEDPIQNLKHMAMPVTAVSLTATALLMRQTRSAMINVLNEDYIRTARAKGLRTRVVIVRHGLRNALIPIVTVFGLPGRADLQRRRDHRAGVRHPRHGPALRRERRPQPGLQHRAERGHVLRGLRRGGEPARRPLLPAAGPAHP